MGVQRALSRFPGSAVAVIVMSVLAITGSACGGADPSSTVAADDRRSPKVTVAGDSIALGFGVAMRDSLEPASGDERILVKAIGENGTGLARPDNFDWPRRLATLARDFPPDVVVFSVGSNDAQDLTDARGTTVVTMADAEAWDEEYSRRLAAVFDEFEEAPTRVIWLGQVRPSDAQVGDVNRHIHELAVEVASTRDWVQVQDLGELTGSGERATSECLSADGLHLSADCYADAATALLEHLDLA